MRRSSLGIALMVLSLAAIVAIFVVPKPLQGIAIIAAVVLIIADVLHRFLGFREERIAAQSLVKTHPGATVLRTALYDFEGIGRVDRARVIAVLADRQGLSFRDRTDAEVVRVPAASILSIELAPLGGRSGLRPALVSRADGSPVRFSVGVGEDHQAAAVVALRAALRG